MAKNFDNDKLEPAPKVESTDSKTHQPNWFEKFAELAEPKKIQSLPEIRTDAKPEEIVAALTQAPPALDYAALLRGDKRALFIGERHDDLSQKDEIIANLHELKAQGGLTHVALEMLNDADMPAVKKYFDGSGDRQTVLDQLKARWAVAPGVPEKYMDFIDAIKKEKLMPVALDEIRRGGDDHGSSQYIDRNEHWAQVIANTLNISPNAKVLVYSGRDHIGYSGGLEPSQGHTNEILAADYGKKSAVVIFSSPLDKESSLERNVFDAACQQRHQTFALKISRDASERPADFIVHPAQTLSAKL